MNVCNCGYRTKMLWKMHLGPRSLGEHSFRQRGAATHDTTGLLITLLTVLFVGLKLTGYIDWSWWWVTAPIWATAVGVFAAAFIWHAVVDIIKRVRK